MNEPSQNTPPDATDGATPQGHEPPTRNARRIVIHLAAGLCWLAVFYLVKYRVVDAELSPIMRDAVAYFAAFMGGLNFIWMFMKAPKKQLPPTVHAESMFDDGGD